MALNDPQNKLLTDPTEQLNGLDTVETCNMGDSDKENKKNTRSDRKSTSERLFEVNDRGVASVNHSEFVKRPGFIETLQQIEDSVGKDNKDNKE